MGIDTGVFTDSVGNNFVTIKLKLKPQPKQPQDPVNRKLILKPYLEIYNY
jgi:hypothetical protein